MIIFISIYLLTFIPDLIRLSKPVPNERNPGRVNIQPRPGTANTPKRAAVTVQILPETRTVIWPDLNKEFYTKFKEKIKKRNALN